MEPNGLMLSPEIYWKKLIAETPFQIGLIERRECIVIKTFD
jgi:hypothetical protein